MPDNNEPTATALTLLETDLGFHSPSTPVQDLLKGKLEQARALLTRFGLKISEGETADLLFLVSVAAWLYRKRDAGEAMPRMLRDEIHDRQVAGSTAGGES